MLACGDDTTVVVEPLPVARTGTSPGVQARTLVTPVVAVQAASTVPVTVARDLIWRTWSAALPSSGSRYAPMCDAPRLESLIVDTVMVLVLTVGENARGLPSCDVRYCASSQARRTSLLCRRGSW